ncbi:pseudouridine synthase [Candidatus Haliotispira prima]|uniref:Pseudouridine synthase n=1 Tax=Candidatus Haliotispira prima TaxID=3034016 RepID=A0ABY8MGX4_9SPIO|nr:pseudouridine synthase [Candidatus Haliotispira prima]
MKSQSGHDAVNGVKDPNKDSNKDSGKESSHSGLQRYISRSGHCSRRKAAELIKEGKVELDGQVCTEPWQPVRPGQRVKVSGVGIRSGEDKRLLYLALYKPPGYLTTNADPQGRACTIDLIRPIYNESLFHVGRLDKNSSGLIFFTNDGDFAQAVQHPSKSIEKEYEVKTRRGIPEFMLKHWQRGVEIDGVRYKLNGYQMLGHREVRLTLTEGLNREIRRVFEHFHIHLKRVHRLRIGTVKLYGLAPGEFRSLRPHEIKVLQSGGNPEPREFAGDSGPWGAARKRKNVPGRQDGHPSGENQRGLYNTPSRPYQGKPKGRPQDKPQGKWEGKREGRPQGKPQGKWEDRREGRPEGKPQGKWEGKREGRPQGTWEGRPQGKWEDKREGKPQGKWEDKREGKPQDKWEDKREGRPQGKWEGKREGRPQSKWEDKREGKPQGKWEDRREGRPQGKWEGKREGRPQSKWEGKREGKPQGKWEGKREGKSQGKWEGRPQGKPQDSGRSRKPSQRSGRPAGSGQSRSGSGHPAGGRNRNQGYKGRG